jgi:hypothetical protein
MPAIDNGIAPRWVAAAPFLIVAALCAALLAAPADVPHVSADDLLQVLRFEPLAIAWSALVASATLARRGGPLAERLAEFSRTIPGMLLQAVSCAAVWCGVTGDWTRFPAFAALTLAHQLMLQPVGEHDYRGPAWIAGLSFALLFTGAVLAVLLPVPPLAESRELVPDMPAIAVATPALLIAGMTYFASLGLLGLASGRLVAGARIAMPAGEVIVPQLPVAAAQPQRADVMMQKGTALSRIIDALGIAVRMPVGMLAALRDAAEAQAAVYAVIVADMAPALHAPGIKAIVTLAGQQAGAQAGRWLGQVRTMRREDRLPFLNMAAQTLATLPAADRARFLDNVERLVRSDKRFTLFEFALCTVLRAELDPVPATAGRAPPRELVVAAMRVLLSVLARAGSADAAQAELAFARGMEHFNGAGNAMVPAPDCSADRLQAALRSLRGTAPLVKESIVKALVDCVLRDTRIRAAEAELLTAVAAALGTGIPAVSRPLLAAARRG